MAGRTHAMQSVLALVLVPSPIAFVVFLMWLQPADPWLTIGSAAFGYLIGEARQVTAYYFGSSRGSAEKQAQLAERVNT